MGETMTLPAATHEALLFAQVAEAMSTIEGTGEALLELRDTTPANEHRSRIVNDLRGWIKTAREDLAAVEALLDAEAS